MKKLTGSAHLFGHDIDTNEIIPARFLASASVEDDLARFCMRDVDPAFPQRVQPGDIIVAGKYFGCGSGVEQAPLALQALGIACIVARSFGRIFYRNAINIGLPVLECSEAFDVVNQGDELEIELPSGKIKNLTKNETYQAESFSPMHEAIIESGGLMQAIASGGVK